MTNYRLLLLLLLLCGWRPWVLARKKSVNIRSFETSPIFQFTAPVYNLTIEENSRGKDVYASSAATIRIGVLLPPKAINTKFRIVDGEKEHFKAESRVVGDFAFLRLRQRHEDFLNRELRNLYEFQIKATCRRRDAPTLETTATVNLIVTDQNESPPVFEQDSYEVEVLENIKPLSDIVQVEASDADIGYNGQIYYSVVGESSEFTLDPVTGWIRTLKPLAAGVYKLDLLAEDRESRLFRKKHEDGGEIRSPSVINRAKAVIRVSKTDRSLPELNIETRPVFGSLYNSSQHVATIRVPFVDADDLVLELLKNDFSPCFRLYKDSEANTWSLETVPGHRPESTWKASLLAKLYDEPSKNVTKIIHVEIDERRSLAFPTSVFRFSVNESSPLGFVVGRIQTTIKNALETDVRKLRYSVISENGVRVPFRIDEKSGVLRVSEWLDFEAITSYKFDVLAELKEHETKALASVEITVKDSNDHSPVFAAKWARGEPVAIENDFPLDTSIVKVEALDSDTGDNGRIQYMLISESDNPFTVNLNTGEVKLWKRPPANASSWQLRVRAFDNGWPYSRSSQMTLAIFKNSTKPPTKFWPSISRDPANHNAPVFSSLPQVVVKEDAEIGKVIARLSATDGDRGYAGIVRYGCWDEYFAVEPFTGDIFVLKDLDELFHSENRKIGRETITYELPVSAYDMGEPVKSSNATLSVTIEDCNNHAPKFEKSFYRVQLKENQPVGTEIVAVKAVDDDAGENGRVSYKLTGGDGHVEIDSTTGVLRIRKEFDRETAEEYCFTVVAHDGGRPSKLGFANITVALEDVNDNAPKCVQPLYKMQIPEDYPSGALVTCIAAYDPDIGENGRITYSLPLLKDQPFRIQSDTGCVFLNLKEPLDYETRTLYNLTVQVADSGEPSLSSSCSLVIGLIDVNENLYPPTFSDIVYEGDVHENMPRGTEVRSVEAVDPEDPYSPVKYSIIDGDGMGYFTIDSKGTIRTSAVLDREVDGSYWLTVKAEDSAAVPLSSFAHVHVKVANKNDHAPVPILPIYFVTAMENTPDAMVVKVAAEDADDADELTENRLRYSIISGDPQSFFSINEHTGYITTRGKRLLDRETQKEHVITVEVCDKDALPLCTTVPVVVSVGDVNDNPPTFESPHYKFDVQADRIGVLCRVFAKDIDEGFNARLSYNITSGDPRFFMDSEGYITTSHALKPDDSFSFTVEATELSPPYNSESTHVTVVAVGVNKQNRETNRKPVLLNSAQWSRLSVSDTDSIEETIGRIEAEDPDGDRLWWTLTAGNINNTFEIRYDTGAIVLAKSLDYLSSEVHQLHLKFAVSDGLALTTGEIFVEVSRYSLKRPQFSALHFKTQISEKTPVGSLIYAMKATVDAETASTPQSQNRVIIYSIHSVESTAAADKIRVDPTSGNVVLTESFEKEIAREFSVVVAARIGQLSNFAMLKISVTNDDSTPPKFLQNEYSVRLLASSLANSVVLTVRAYDLDPGRNGIVFYSIVAGNDDGYFAVDEISGEIRNVKAFPLSDFLETILTVRATDRSVLKLSDSCTVRIQVVFDEEWIPVFQRSVYSVSVQGNTPVGTLLAMVGVESATGGLRYFLQDTCFGVDLHQISGAVYLRRQLDSDRDGAIINCTIKASHPMGAEAFARLIVNIEDVNMYAPFFNRTVYTGFIQEGMPAGSVVVSEGGSPLFVKAYDRDTGLNGLVNYRIASPVEPYFTVDFISGAVRTRTELDFEKVQKWSFYVQASDMGSTAQSSFVPALVTVFVRDVNDVAPKFGQKNFFATLFVPTVKGVVITKLSAYDPDTVGSLRYFAKSNDLKHLFTVDDLDGVVRVHANDSAMLKLQDYKMSVVVTDGIHSDAAVLTISVKSSSQSKNGLHFPQNEYHVTLIENTTFSTPQPLMVLSTVGQGAAAVVMYRILNPHPEFVISHGSGQLIWLGGALDREIASQVKLLVQATLRGSSEEHSQCVFVVDVEDINDCEPQFVHLPYVGVISRGAKVGDKVLSVKAVDMDQGENGAVRYSLKEGHRYFKINKYDGRINLAASISAIDTETMTLVVEASDQGSPNRSSVATVTIEVVGHEVPVFSQRSYRARVSEGASIGEHILTLVARSNGAGLLGYLVESGDPKKQFDLDFNKGFLRVHRRLDRETQSFYNLSVAAFDASTNGVYAHCFVEVEIADVNDNPPRFLKPIYRTHVSETAPVGTELLQVSAVDADLEGSTISFAITGAHSSVLSIDAVTGRITLMKHLDFEERDKLVFTLTASDSDGLSTTATLLLYVDDANDNAPVFAQSVFVCTIEENADRGQFLFKLDVSDKDSVSSLPEGRPFDFSVIGGHVDLVSVDRNSGVVQLARPLSNADMQAKHRRLNVSVSDGIFTSYAELSVAFAPSVNRQPLPKFDRKYYSASVKENGKPGSVITIVRAKGGIEPVRYEIVGAKQRWPINLDEKTGKITTRVALDYESQSSYRIPIAAVDGAGRRAFAFVLLSVINENDNTPYFVTTRYEVSALANANERETLFMVHATDDDLGDQIEYSIVQSRSDFSNYLKVHPKQGILSVQKSLHSLEGPLTLFVRATDLANPPHHSEAEVRISVLPSNASLPRFSSHHYIFNTTENVSVGTPIGKLEATEEGSLKGGFVLLTNGLKADFPFSINKATGEIVVTTALHHQKAPVWHFVVRLVPQAVDIPGSLALVTVYVGGASRNVPSFLTAPEEVTVPEDAPTGTAITVFTASNVRHDLSPTIVYALEKNEGSRFFSIDPVSGWLMVSATLDRELHEKHIVTVLATDNDNLTSKTDVRIVVTDVNDSPPAFDRNVYQFDVDLEEGEEERLLGKVNVTDADLPQSNHLELMITVGNEHNLFRLSKRGELFLAKNPSLHLLHDYNLTLLAFDGKYSSTAIVKVNLRPGWLSYKCADEYFVLNISEDASVGTVILEGYSAVPPTFRFEFIEGTSNKFKTEKDGRVLLIEKLDRETVDQYFFTVRGMNAHQLCVRQALLTIEDVNDESPRFEQLEYIVSIKENLDAANNYGRFLLKLNAEDGDLGVAGEVHYEFDPSASETIRDIFRLDRKTGALFASKSLDRETCDRYVIPVRAVDGEGNFSAASVVVEVANENDNEPQFELDVYKFRFLESAPVGFEIGHIRAVDKDVDDVVSYRTEAGDGVEKYFSVGKSTGVLTLSMPVDYEITKHYSFVVVAADSGTPPLRGSCTVEIEILDVNDNAPKFVKSSYEATVREHSAVGSKVLKVVARDADSGNFGSIKYQMTGGDSLFAIKDDGWIVVAGKLDREYQTGYRLRVSAIDGGSPALLDTAEVIVELEDENDNPPIFTPCNMTAVVQEGVEPGYVLLTAAISDADAEPNAGPFRLNIVGDGSESFSFDSHLNLITNSRLSSTRKDTYLLNVIAYDRGGLSAECPLTIHVREESRHPPVISPLTITLKTYMNEFLGGNIGVISAQDQDKSDTLRYSLNEDSAEFFGVNALTGLISAKPGLGKGTFNFTVSVSDGKYTVQAPVSVKVDVITQEALENSIKIRVHNISAEEFLGTYLQKLEKLFSHHGTFKVISVQEAYTDRTAEAKLVRRRRSRLRLRRSNKGPKNVYYRGIDVVFALASKADQQEQYIRASMLNRLVKKPLNDFAIDNNIEIDITTEVCYQNLCRNAGECLDRLYLQDSSYPLFTTKDAAFSSPRHKRTFECLCREGYGGDLCETEINLCSKDPCGGASLGNSGMMCVPTNTKRGYECVCPPGTTGEHCAISTCDKDPTHCSKYSEISVSGDGFLQMLVATSLEESLQLAFKFRTLSSDAVVMHGANGNDDFHILEIQKGYLQYEWNCGAGVGMVNASGIRISDGKWHLVNITRRGRNVNLTVDGVYKFSGSSPIGGEVVNLRRDARRLTFGAEVRYQSPGSHSAVTSELPPLVLNGMVGCFASISVDQFDLPKTKLGLRLYNTEMGCSSLGRNACVPNPCKNGGHCRLDDDVSFSCACLPNYFGKLCELTPSCLPNPCIHGGRCLDLNGGFYCHCPPGFSGRNCEDDLWDPCASGQLCRPFGQCVPHGRGFFYCNCSEGYTGQYCEVPSPTLFSGPFSLKVGLVHIAIAIGVIVVALLLLCFLCIYMLRCCMRRTGQKQSKTPLQASEFYEPNNFNPRLSKASDSIQSTFAPPLPPRIARGFGTKPTGIPTLQVRPLPMNERFGSSSVGGSRSPSLAESMRCKSRRISTPNSQKNADVVRNCISSADELEQQTRSELYRYGKRLSEEDSEEVSSSSSQMRSVASRRSRPRRSRIRRSNRGDQSMALLQNDQIAEETVANVRNWRMDAGPRMSNSSELPADLNNEYVKPCVIRSSNHCFAVGSTILAPRDDNDEYMTMLPLNRRLPPTSVESQRKPLLETSDSEASGVDEVRYVYPDEICTAQRQKPLPPAHGSRRKIPAPEVSNGRVYDNPSRENPLAKFNAKVCTSNGSLKRPLSSPNLSGDFGHIDSENDTRPDTAAVVAK